MDYSTNSFTNKRILVTGANGFVGKYLIKELRKREARITAIIRDIKNKREYDDVSVLHVDLVKNMGVIAENYEIVYHLAALTDLKKCLEDPLEAYNVNVMGTLNLLTNCKNVKKFVYVSTLGVYGEQKKFPVAEDAPAIPIEPYAASKLAAEAVVQGFCRSHKIPFSIVRLFNVYGPGQSTRFVIPSLLEKALIGKEIELENGESTRDFIYIEDAVEALIKISLLENNEIYNVGSGKETSVKDVLKIIEKLISKNIYPHDISMTDTIGVKRSVADISKIKRDTGWNPRTSLEEGIARMIQYKYGI